MDVLQEIKDEHQGFKELITQIKDSKSIERKKLFGNLHSDIYGHHMAEELVLFPDVKENSGEAGNSIVLEMVEEHNLLTYQLSVIQKTPLDDETWEPKLEVLKEVLNHHIEEEERELLSLAKKVLERQALVDKYNQFEEAMEKFKKELLMKIEE